MGKAEERSRMDQSGLCPEDLKRWLGEMYVSSSRFFYLRGKIRHSFIACDMREKSLRKDGGKMMTAEEMKTVDIRTVNRDELVDIRDVVIDQDAPKEEKIKSFMRQIRNPYCFKVGNVVVKTTFADTDATLDDRLEHYLWNK